MKIKLLIVALAAVVLAGCNCRNNNQTPSSQDFSNPGMSSNVQLLSNIQYEIGNKTTVTIIVVQNTETGVCYQNIKSYSHNMSAYDTLSIYETTCPDVEVTQPGVHYEG